MILVSLDLHAHEAIAKEQIVDYIHRFCSILLPNMHLLGSQAANMTTNISSRLDAHASDPRAADTMLVLLPRTPTLH